MHLIAELIDTGQISGDPAEMKFFDFNDFQIDLLPEVPKPEFIPDLRERQDDYASVSSSWVDDIIKSPRLKDNILKYKDKWNVIGEYTMLKSLYWGTPTDIYMSQLTVNRSDNDNYHIFEPLNNKQVSEYTDGIGNPRGKYIVLMNMERYSNGDIKGNWLAINPILAGMLEWIRDDTVLFGWKNKKDELIAQSVYWRNGNTGMLPPHLHSESGAGWFVLVSDEALEDIKSLGETLIIEQKIRREYHQNNTFQEKELKHVKNFSN